MGYSDSSHTYKHSHSHTQTCIQVELSHTRALQNTEPNRRGSFLNITIISLYCNARTDWLSPGETNIDPQVIQEVGSRRGDAIFTQTNTFIPKHRHIQSLLYSETKTTHSKSSFANHYTFHKPRLFCLIWL